MIEINESEEIRKKLKKEEVEFDYESFKRLTDSEKKVIPKNNYVSNLSKYIRLPTESIKPYGNSF